MKLKVDMTGKTLYLKRLTSGGSVQLTEDPGQATDVSRHEMPEAIRRINKTYSNTLIKVFSS